MNNFSQKFSTYVLGISKKVGCRVVNTFAYYAEGSRVELRQGIDNLDVIVVFTFIKKYNSLYYLEVDVIF